MFPEQRPRLFARRAFASHDGFDLLLLVHRSRVLLTLRHALERHDERAEFGENAPSGPNVDRTRVMSRPEQQLGRAIPQSHHGSVFVQRLEQSPRVHEPRQTEIGNLHHPALAPIAHHEHVLRLYVPVHDPIRVQIMQSVQQLPRRALHHPSRHQPSMPSMPRQYHPQIVLRVIYRQRQRPFLLIHDHPVQVHDVFVLHRSQRRHLAKRRRRQSHDLIPRDRPRLRVPSHGRRLERLNRVHSTCVKRARARPVSPRALVASSRALVVRSRRESSVAPRLARTRRRPRVHHASERALPDLSHDLAVVHRRARARARTGATREGGIVGGRGRGGRRRARGRRRSPRRCATRRRWRSRRARLQCQSS
mmetsp:Transcript_6954/g.28026  ORF Transcript_6954/g.28026 Transcript_6954/m.28026 type:complete len:364 (-) Transcript_6954:5-1096(-)